MRFSIINIWSYYEDRACASIMNDIAFHFKMIKNWIDYTKQIT